MKKFTRIKESYLVKKKNLILSGFFQDPANNSNTNHQNEKDADKGDNDAKPAEIKKTKNKSTSKNASSDGTKNGRKSLNFIEAKRDELIATIANLVGCIGCRVSVERFYKQLSKNSEIISKINETIYPILIDSNENLILNGNLFLVDPFKLYSIFYLNNRYLAI